MLLFVFLDVFFHLNLIMLFFFPIKQLIVKNYIAKTLFLSIVMETLHSVKMAFCPPTNPYLLLPPLFLRTSHLNGN